MGPIPGKSGMGMGMDPRSPIPGKSGMGMGMGIGGSVPCLGDLTVMAPDWTARPA